MFNSKKIKALVDEINKLNEIVPKIDRKVNMLESENSRLNAEIFKLKYTDGLLSSTYKRYAINRSCIFQYSHRDKINEVILCDIDREYKYYKTFIDNNKAYIGLSFDNDAKYFIVDMNNNTSIECTDASVIRDKAWLDS